MLGLRSNHWVYQDETIYKSSFGGGSESLGRIVQNKIEDIFFGNKYRQTFVQNTFI